MRANVRVVAAAAVFSSATFAAQAQQAVQWRVEDGGNGHWYQFVPGPTCWSDAVSLAENNFGHLATFTIPGEQAFMMDRLPNLSQAWIGGMRDPGTDIISGWRWVTGEPWSSGAIMWGEDNPGCCYPDEFFLSVWTGFPAGVHDVPACYSVVSGAAVEWSADCNNDGIVDYGQILSGQLVDANSNGIPDTCELGPCAGDVIPDGVINGVDLAAVLSAWGTTGQGQFPADANRDGIVNGTDLSYVLSGWGTCVTVPTWATLLEAAPDPTIVTSPTLRAAIAATGRPWRVRDTATQIEFVLIPPGTFNMGCTASNAWGCDPDENPVHAVTLTQPFYMGRYEVTQAQWTARMGSNPSGFQSGPDAPQRPVENVSWNALQTFLSQTSMRLPTEAEWEYAYRAGTMTAFHSMPGYPNGTNDDSLVGNIAWFNGNSSNQTRPVGGKASNGFGLHDMAGNVDEWVNDWFGTYPNAAQVDPVGPASGWFRVIRGGSWPYSTIWVRSSARDDFAPEYTGSDVGFRVARNP